MNYSRPILLIGGSLACIGINFWLIMTGHFRIPLFVFIGFIAAMALILPRLPRPTMSSRHAQSGLARAAASSRRLAILSTIGMTVTTLLLAMSGFRIGEAPRWALLMALAVGWCWVWCYLRMAKLFRAQARSQQDSKDIP